MRQCITAELEAALPVCPAPTVAEQGPNLDLGVQQLDVATDSIIDLSTHVQFDDGAVDDYSDLPPVSGSAQQHSRPRPFCPSGLRDDGYSPSLYVQV